MFPCLIITHSTCHALIPPLGLPGHSAELLTCIVLPIYNRCLIQSQVCGPDPQEARRVLAAVLGQDPRHYECPAHGREPGPTGRRCRSGWKGESIRGVGIRPAQPPEHLKTLPAAPHHLTVSLVLASNSSCSSRNGARTTTSTSPSTAICSMPWASRRMRSGPSRRSSG